MNEADILRDKIKVNVATDVRGVPISLFHNYKRKRAFYRGIKRNDPIFLSDKKFRDNIIDIIHKSLFQSKSLLESVPLIDDEPKNINFPKLK